MKFIALVRSGLLSLAIVLLPSAWAAQPNHDAFYVFGDSLSDNGNDLAATQSFPVPIPPSASPHKTYYQGRFSNGPVAVEYLWVLMERDARAKLTPFAAAPKTDVTGKVGVNFAYGGSTSDVADPTLGGFPVPGVLGQIEDFRKALQAQGKKPKPKALYMVWTGANDYLFIGRGPDKVVANITSALEQLYVLGARNFLVPNLPDIGLSPLVQVQGQGPAFTALTKQHNALLAKSLDQLSAKWKDARIVRVDVFALTDNLLGLLRVVPPALAVVSPGTGAESCLYVNPAACPNVAVELSVLPSAPFLFWDALHPTTTVHGIVGKAMYDRLSAAQ